MPAAMFIVEDKEATRREEEEDLGTITHLWFRKTRNIFPLTMTESERIGR
jgi:hypothetical protein